MYLRVNWRKEERKDLFENKLKGRRMGRTI
jgi:hypothetical protein